MYHGLVDIKIEDFFTEKKYLHNRGHSLKLELPKIPKTDIGHNAFSHRVIIPWNNLPNNVINSGVWSHLNGIMTSMSLNLMIYVLMLI